MLLKIVNLAILLLNFVSLNSLAAKSISPFEGSWDDSPFKIVINNCTKAKCHFHLEALTRMYICEVNEDLTLLSDKTALFKVESESYASSDKGRTYPIYLTIWKNILTIKIPNESREAARKYCGAGMLFDGDYYNINMPRIYRTSFNCDKADTKIDKAICQSDELAYWDLSLSKLYLKLKTKYGTHAVVQQKAWLKKRNQCVNSSSLELCLLDSYRERVESLENELKTK